MNHKFILDKEINLNDCDYLKTKVYSDNLTSIIKNIDADKVFTIGLFGSWGTGKSSIIETSKQDFDQTKTKFITYDAWQYVNDSFRRMFLRKLREDLRYEETDLMKKFYENESTDIGEKYRISSGNFFRTLVILLMIFVLEIILIKNINAEVETKITIAALVSFAAFAFTIISGVLYKLKISVTKPHLFAPEQFEECFNEIVSNSLKKPNAILKWVKGNNSIQNLEKLVIVIDNIDRCSNDIAYNLLTDIKTFLSSEPYSIVFVIPVDDVALRKHIINSNKNSDDSDKDKEEFLRKFFNVTIRIKPYGETDMFAFAKQINENYNLNFKPETINLASKEYAKNPRRVIQLFNNLLAELNYYDTEFVQKNETLICCVLIAREEYSDYYNSIINSPKLFIDGSIGEKDREDLKRFIRIFHNALGKIEIADLSRVLTNSHNQFDDLAAETKDAIDTHNDDKILNATEIEQERIFDYIIHQLGNSVKNSLIETELVAYFDLCAKINIKHALGSHVCKKIDEHIIPHIAIVIAKTSNHRNLCTYAFNRSNQGNNTIKKALIEDAKRSKNQEKGGHWQSLFTAVLKVFDDRNTAIALSSTYTEYSQFAKNRDFSTAQFDFLISDEYVQQKIAELPLNDDSNEILLDIDNEKYRKVEWLFENKQNIKETTYGHFFAHIIGENNDDSRMRGKSMEEIVSLLQFIQPCLDLIPNRKLTTIWTESGTAIPETLYKLIVNDRKMPHSSYPNDIRYDQTKNFIDECMETESNIQDIIDFVITIYRITNNKTEITLELKKLLAKYREQLNIEFVKLIEKEYNLRLILDLILEDDDYSNENTLILLKHCFDEGKELKYAEEKLKTKISDLIIFAQSQKSERIFALLESLIAEERYKAVLSGLIIEKDCTFINSLPQKFLKLAVGTFKKDNFISFANNFDFLKVIIQHGNNVQKGYVIDILITKLDNNENIEESLNLIDAMESISSFDQSGLLHSHLDKYLRDNKETLEEELSKRIKQTRAKTKVKNE